MPVTFGLFDTLVDADLPSDPAEAIGRELERHDVPVPEDWHDAYHETHVDAPDGATVPLPAHVAHALRSRGVDAPNNAPRRACVSAFDPEVRTRSGAVEAVTTVGEQGPVGLLASAPAPELVGRVLVRAGFSRGDFDVVVTSLGSGWEKPDRRAFETLADRFGADPEELVHVGVAERGDRGVVDAGGRFVDASVALDTDDGSLLDVVAGLDTR